MIKVLHFKITFVKGTVGSITTAYYSLKVKPMKDINLQEQSLIQAPV